MRKHVKGFLGAALTMAMIVPGMSCVAEENVELTFTYWGSPVEKKVIEAAMDAFEEAHPGITAAIKCRRSVDMGKICRNMSEAYN